MYSKLLAEAMKGCAGKKYRPSNGTEGEIFMEEFCYQCVYDDPANEDYCDILTRTMTFDIDDKEYPTEWIIGADGQPVCTRFKKR